MKKYLPLVITVVSVALVIVWQIKSSHTSYYLIAASILVLSMLPLFISFEKGKHTARELALISSLIAIAVVGRAVFYLIPQVKPIAAVVIVSGACLGAKRGYVVGVFSMFISNFIFGQGIWTPFQMVALGAVGLVSGLILSDKARRLPLALVGFVLTFVLYALLVDLSSVLMMTSTYTPQSVLAIYLAGLPFNLAFAGSTAIFLFLFGEPFIRKINRITKKYGII